MRFEELEANKEIRKEEITLTKRALDLAENSQSHLAYLAQQIKKDDTIKINTTTLSKKEATAQYAESVKDDGGAAQTYYIDGDYKVTGSNVKNHTITIEDSALGTKTISTKMLAEAEKKNLYDELGKADIAGYIPSFSLRISVAVRDTEILDIQVVGIGPKRPAAMSPAEVLASARQRHEQQALRQGRQVQKHLPGI